MDRGGDRRAMPRSGPGQQSAARQPRDVAAADQMHVVVAGEQPGDRRVERIEPAGERAEGGKDEALPAGDEAPSGDPTAAHGDARLRMVVPADLADGIIRRLVAEDQLPEPEFAV